VTFSANQFDSATLGNISRVRLEIGDTIKDAGVKPDGSNFSDEELSVWLEEESEHVMHTVIRACLALARLWANRVNITVGPLKEEFSKVAEHWSAMAKSLTEQYGPPVSAGSGFAVATRRVDGYSEAALTSSE
jgi:hypothetical protein